VETHRRTLVKSILWRVIGVVWTWLGAYIILLLLPPAEATAAIAASAIVLYHHSTRLFMYYGYERLWAAISWGKDEPPRRLNVWEKVAWIGGSTVALVGVIFLAAVLKH